jgi:hypothetical protein
MPAGARFGGTRVVVRQVGLGQQLLTGPGTAPPEEGCCALEDLPGANSMQHILGYFG